MRSLLKIKCQEKINDIKNILDKFKKLIRRDQKMIKKLLLLVAINGLLGIINAESPFQQNPLPLTCFPFSDGQRLTEPTDFRQAEDTLKYDGYTYTAIGLTAGGTWYAAVRFTPVTPCTIKSAIFFQFHAVSASGWVYLREAGTATSPGAKIDSVSYTDLPATWHRVNFSTARYRPAGIDFWISIKITQVSSVYPLGCDSGPSVVPYRSFISSTGATWQSLPSVFLDYNWNIRAIGKVMSGNDDVGVDAIIAPAIMHNLNTSMVPIARIKNYAINPQTNFPVICSIIGPTKDVRYIDIETVPALAANDTIWINFDAWIPTITETIMVIIRTKFSGDMNPANDRKSQLTQIGAFLLTENFTSSTFPPTNWTRVPLNVGDSTWHRRLAPFHTTPGAAAVWWSFGRQSEWLITPFITLTGSSSGSYYLKWWCYGYRHSVYGDHYYTKITTDGTNWTVLYDLSAPPVPDTGWNYFTTPVQIDLSSYAGQTVKIAWHAFDGYPQNIGIWYQWLIDDIEVGYPVGIAEQEQTRPNVITTLRAPKPNPVTNGLANISFAIAEPTKVSLKIYDASGRLIKILINEFMNSGVYNFIWNGKDDNNHNVAEGIYFYTLQTDKQNFTKKLVFTR